MLWGIFVIALAVIFFRAFRKQTGRPQKEERTETGDNGKITEEKREEREFEEMASAQLSADILSGRLRQ